LASSWQAPIRSQRQRTHPHSPGRRRPRPGNRQEHHARTRGNPRPQPPCWRRAPGDGAAAGRATAHW